MTFLQLFQSSSFRFYLRKEKKEIERRGQSTQETNIVKEKKVFLQTREEKSAVDEE